MVHDKKFMDLFVQNWSVIEGPIRPSAEEKTFYEEHVRRAAERENPEMLILGATPEFRDMGIRHGMKPVSMDIAPPIFEAMKAFMVEDGEEELIHCDWLEMPTDREYDLILGDGALNVIHKEGQRRFFEKQAPVLKGDGRIVQRIFCRNENHSPELLTKAIREHREKKIDKLLFSYVSPLVCSVRDNHYPELAITEMFEQVLCSQLTEEEVEGIRPFMFGKETYMTSAEEVGDLVDGLFEIERIWPHDDLGHWGMTHIYVFGKKP